MPGGLVGAQTRLKPLANSFGANYYIGLSMKSNVETRSSGQGFVPEHYGPVLKWSLQAIW